MGGAVDKAFDVMEALVEHSRLADIAAATALPHLEDLQRRTGRTVHLALLSGDEAVYVAKVEGDKPYRLASRVGMSLHLHRTSIGKAMLAAMGDDEVAGIAGRTGLPGRSPGTITEVGPLLAEVAATRARGWAEDHEVRARARRAAVVGLLGMELVTGEALILDGGKHITY